MSALADRIYVKSHVSRDLLQSAALFKNEQLAVWEYVANGLQYVDPGVRPEVRVELDSKARRITIGDNGRGMSFGDLQNFFVMHGENADRKAGRAGRGRFGTGKSAAFGIADRLVVSTTRSGKRTRVALDRKDVEGMSDDSPIPVRVLEKERPVTDANGTLIEIEGVRLPRLDAKHVIRYVERNLARWGRDARVWVNQHECVYRSPRAIRTLLIEPDAGTRAKLGACELILRVAAAPLAEDERGVAIYCKGMWLETTLAGSEGREMSEYVFGEIDVAQLDSDTSSVAAFDMSRSTQLNRANELVRTIIGFIGSQVDKLRKELAAQERARKASEEARRLAQHASDIARVINEDFSDFWGRVPNVPAPATGSPAAEGGRVKSARGEPERAPAESQPAAQEPVGRPPRAAADGGPRSTSRGGFSLQFRNEGQANQRARYVAAARQIVVNLDHPQLAAALGAGRVDDVSFQRLAYEVAFLEYALALASELASRGEYLDVTDPIVEIGETINRVARRAAALYERA
ncbi:MAG TPA: ATP-binding protein [Polyangiales bacterium]|nr:ATP-binding protein [Polyangiales bacterium]